MMFCFPLTKDLVPRVHYPGCRNFLEYLAFPKLYPQLVEIISAPLETYRVIPVCLLPL